MLHFNNYYSPNNKTTQKSYGTHFHSAKSVLLDSKICIMTMDYDIIFVRRW